MINRVVLVGRLTKDPELRYTTNGVAVVSFNLAVNRSFTNSQGEREADFVSCVIWRKGAENFANFTHKGSLVGVDGRIQTSSYDNQQGQRIFRTDVILENFSLLEPKNQNGILVQIILVIRILNLTTIRTLIILTIKVIQIINIEIQIRNLRIHFKIIMVASRLVMMICHFSGGTI
jgi:single stranded DNA-binding protein (ssb)